jgi:hypothetical protein
MRKKDKEKEGFTIYYWRPCSTIKEKQPQEGLGYRISSITKYRIEKGPFSNDSAGFFY